MTLRVYNWRKNRCASQGRVSLMHQLHEIGPSSFGAKKRQESGSNQSLARSFWQEDLVLFGCHMTPVSFKPFQKPITVAPEK